MIIDSRIEFDDIDASSGIVKVVTETKHILYSVRWPGQADTGFEALSKAVEFCKKNP